MASDILHIKDGYYFDVPAALYPAHHKKATDFRDNVGYWFVRNDNEYQDWEAEHIIEGLTKIGVSGADTEHLVEQWHKWQHGNEMRHGRPLDRYIDEKVAAMNVKAKAWAKKEESQAKEPLKDYVATHSDLSDAWMTQLVLDPVKAKAWTTLKRDIDAHKMVDDYLATPRAQWSNEKIATYNKYLSGKVFIPQPFGTIRNGYERESGFAIASS